jgi:hypothetical protein
VNILWWIGGIDYNGIVRLVVFHEVCVVVAGPSPCSRNSLSVGKITATVIGLPNVHIGIEVICMAREKASCSRHQRSVRSQDISE